MSKMMSDPVRIIPRKAAVFAFAMTAIIGVASHFLNLPIVEILGGYWLGFIANLVNFRLIVIGSKTFLDRKEQGLKASMRSNLMIRYAIYIGVFLLTWRLGTWALLASFFGISTISTVIKLDGFFTIGYEKKPEKESEL